MKKILIGAFALLTAVAVTSADEIVMFGSGPSRNMVSNEQNVPDDWDVKSGKNILWSMELGSQTYAGPVVYGNKVFVGTNNERMYNPKLKGDRGNVMAFDIESGELLWQSAHTKLPSGRVNDWPLQGVCSTPAIEGNRIWYVSNKAEVICADVEGFRDGENDGPYTEETETSEIDEDVIWKYDLIGELDVFPHNLAAGSPLIVGDILYATTGNGVDEGHINIPATLAPSFVAINKNTGELVWENAEPGKGILHGTWSNPSYGVIGGQPQVLFPGGDGVLYSFEPKTGKLLWQFDMNPKDSKWILGGRGTRNNVISMAVVWEGLIYIAVGQDPEHGEGEGNLWAIDAKGKTGDITETGAVWHLGGEDFHRTMSTAAIKDGLMFISDLSGFLYCLDPKTGKQHWKYDAFAAIWGSPYVVDGKVFLGDEDGDVAILAADKKMKVIREINVGAAVYTTPVAKDGVLYVVSRNKIFAIKEGAKPKAPKVKEPKDKEPKDKEAKEAKTEAKG
jgi:outer membrane protein assembly factor BamB